MSKNLELWMQDSGLHSYWHQHLHEEEKENSCNQDFIMGDHSNGGTMPETLSELFEAIRNFDGCLLKKTSRNTVIADGSIKSGVMIIGEAPGATEDEQGIPFCGLSGKLLNQMLGAINLAREDVYITNVIFWRPESNRRPTPEEIECCRPFVERHIALIKPKILLILGSTAATALLNDKSSVTTMRGRVLTYNNKFLNAAIPTIVSYHPSYLLRMPSRKKDAWQDLLLLKNNM